MAQNVAQMRGNPFSRANSPSSSPSTAAVRPKSAVFTSSLSTPQGPSHNRHLSHSSNTFTSNGDVPTRRRSSSKTSTPTSTTFAPSFIKPDEMRREPERLTGIEGENDFSGKRYVWLKDPTTAFVKGWIVEELGGSRILVQCDDGSVRSLDILKAKLTICTATGSKLGLCRQGQSGQIR